MRERERWGIFREGERMDEISNETYLDLEWQIIVTVEQWESFGAGAEMEENYSTVIPVPIYDSIHNVEMMMVYTRRRMMRVTFIQNRWFDGSWRFGRGQSIVYKMKCNQGSVMIKRDRFSLFIHFVWLISCRFRFCARMHVHTFWLIQTQIISLIVSFFVH